ncbi:multidrug DMT transporter permease [Azospirillum thiophilum]|uniref:Multidrug DMT transporter permease n=2 Tax=Azospirillum thiophilum TaxID=528244 RepID=A0AAC8ZVS3_9PROT|nr:multidrug DMT transporter permease [Azospirillum thiophilum]KJR63909.1 multidrug DMT transporter permease [Azospirillum thiophilum]
MPIQPAQPGGPAPNGTEPMRAILLVVLGVAFLSCSDATAKYLARTLPPVEIVWLRYLVFTALVMPLALRGGSLRVLKTTRPGLQVLRGLGMLGSALFFIMAMQHLPLAEAAAISFVSPAFVTVLSILLLGETVGIRRWAALLVGLAGVTIVIRPGADGFQPAVLLPVLTAFCWALGLVATRRMTVQESPLTTMVWSALTGLIVLTALLPLHAAWPTPWEMLLGVFIGLVYTAAQWLLILAYRQGEASVLAPFTYVQLIWSTALGFLVFGAVPDHWTFVGMGVIIASGVYTAHRERLRARERRLAAA